MPINPAETPESEMPIKIGVSTEFPRGKVDRRISVAPMMDWTDELSQTNKIMNLEAVELA
jgi:hypothetical protein